VRIKRLLGAVFSTVKIVVRRLREDRCLRVAAALSYTTLLALVPLITVAFSMLSVFPVFEQWSGAFEDFMYRNFVPAAGDIVRENLTRFTQQAGKLTAVGLIVLLFSALFLLATVEDNFNDIWRVHKGRSVFQRLLVYWAVISLGPLLIVASLSVSSYVLSLPFLPDQKTYQGFMSNFLPVLPFVLEIIAFVLFFMAMPNCSVRFRDALAGGIVAAVLFECAKKGFAIYVLNFRSYEVIYGALATIPIFLIWIYLSWLMVLIGAHVAAALPDVVREPVLGKSRKSSGAVFD